MAGFKQDMPPVGGYAPIIYQRIPLKKAISAKFKLAACCVATAIGVYMYHYEKDKETLERIEMRCVRLALQPMIQAEADRMILKQLKKNRDMEEEVMKDVKGWEVGKWKSSPVYLSLGPDEYFKPHLDEYIAHAPPDAVARLNYLLVSN